MDELRERRIDKAIAGFKRARQMYALSKLLEQLKTNPENFTAHLDRLRLPLPPKGF